MKLTKHQEQIIFDNYLLDSEMNIATLAKCDIDQVRRLIGKTPIAKLYDVCRVYNFDKQRSKNFTFLEPKFSKDEIQHLKDAISGVEISSPVESRMEIINGKQSFVFQSRINYE